MNARFMGPLVGSWSKNVPQARIYTYRNPSNPLSCVCFHCLFIPHIDLVWTWLDQLHYTAQHSSLVKCLLHTEIFQVLIGPGPWGRDRDELSVWSTCSEALTLLGRSRLALALQIAMTMGRFPSLQAMCSGVLPWRSCWSWWQWCLRRQRTTSTWHLRTARWRAVCPSWRQTVYLWSNRQQLITVYVYGNTKGSINPLRLHRHREMIPV